MANVLVVAEFSEGKLKKTTHSAVTFAQSVAKGTGGSFSILAIGAGAKASSGELAGFGAAKVFIADHASVANYVCERFAPTVVATAKKGFDVVVAAASAYGKDLIPRVAAALGAGYANDISSVKVEGAKLTYRRPMFAGNAYGFCEVTTPIQAVSVRQSEFAPAQPSGSATPVEDIALAPPSAGADRVEFVSFDQVKSERPELAEAGVVVSGGRALKERFKEVLDPLADALGAAVGASRAACDAGYAPSDLQVGQTGKVVAPKLYFAIGISGAIQHLAGMKGSKVIVAINKDAEAPIFQVADYGLVADLFQAVPELVTQIRKAKSA
ncbi:MAG TPA: electron transfer flavoprotein subunit alpha/FixB family protein [Polyangiaceae bacterium]|nr:electron transfer flavoprotein subunit alpha/FixB family protein [Polyangiaceae bacterium]